MKVSKKNLAALVVTGIVVAAFWFRPTKLASFHCSDGSSLTIYSATFGTDHLWLRGSFPLSRSSSEWKSDEPCMALWGEWNGRSEMAHSFRFALVHETTGKEWVRLRPQMESFGPGQMAGVIAITTNSPWMSQRVRVTELTNETVGLPAAEFVVKNTKLIDDRSKGRSKLQVRLNFSHRWSLGSDLLIANGRTSNEILVEKVYNFGPIIVSRKFD